MRVNEEIDALEVMGIPSKIYLVSTRMLACFIVLPFMYILALGVSYLGSYVVQMVQVPSGTISSGVYSDYFFRFLNVQDLFFSMIKAVVFAFLIVCVAVYYGYNVTGGAVGIGKAVAKTMAVALVVTVVVNAVVDADLLGHQPQSPHSHVRGQRVQTPSHDSDEVARPGHRDGAPGPAGAPGGAGTEREFARQERARWGPPGVHGPEHAAGGPAGVRSRSRRGRRRR